MSRRVVVLLIAILTSIGLAAPPAAAAVPGGQQSLQAQINQVLRSSPGGVQIAPNQISWRNGTVILTIPMPGTASASPFGFANCGYGWYCFWQDINWGGRRLQFSFYNELDDLANWGFTNQASSWQDNSGLYVIVYDGNNTLWHMYPYSSSSWVGSAANDRADHFYGCQSQCW